MMIVFFLLAESPDQGEKMCFETNHIARSILTKKDRDLMRSLRIRRERWDWLKRASEMCKRKYGVVVLFNCYQKGCGLYGWTKSRSVSCRSVVVAASWKRGSRGGGGVLCWLVGSDPWMDLWEGGPAREREQAGVSASGGKAAGEKKTADARD